MTAIDTSVAVAAFATWHEDHAAAVDALAKRPRLIAQVGLETYSVLTRLPSPHRAHPEMVLTFLHKNFDRRWLLLGAGEQRRLLSEAAAVGIAGGAVYDALIAATARNVDETLITLDRRALPTYQAIGVDVRLLA